MRIPKHTIYIPFKLTFEYNTFALLSKNVGILLNYFFRPGNSHLKIP